MNSIDGKFWEGALIGVEFSPLTVFFFSFSVLSQYNVNFESIHFSAKKIIAAVLEGRGNACCPANVKQDTRMKSKF